MNVGELTVMLKAEIKSSELESAARKTENRFKKVSQRFALGLKGAIGRGIKGGLKGGAIASAIAAVASVLDTGYSKIEAKINDFLQVTDNTSTLAGQLRSEGVDVTAGQYAALESVALQSGVDPQVLVKSLSKFIDARARGVDEVQAFNTGNAVNDFLSFFKTLSLNVKDGVERTQILTNVFGQREGIALFELSQADIDGSIDVFLDSLKRAGVTLADYTKIIDKGGALELLQAQLAVRRKIEDTVKTGQVINEETILAQDRVDRARLEQDRKALTENEKLSKAELAQIEMATSFADAKLQIQTKLIPAVAKFGEQISKVINELQSGNVFKALATFANTVPAVLKTLLKKDL